jgi:hypothetical protein
MALRNHRETIQVGRIFLRKPLWLITAEQTVRQITRVGVRAWDKPTQHTTLIRTTAGRLGRRKQ